MCIQASAYKNRRQPLVSAEEINYPANFLVNFNHLLRMFWFFPTFLFLSRRLLVFFQSRATTNNNKKHTCSAVSFFFNFSNGFFNFFFGERSRCYVHVTINRFKKCRQFFLHCANWDSLSLFHSHLHASMITSHHMRFTSLFFFAKSYTFLKWVSVFFLKLIFTFTYNLHHHHLSFMTTTTFFFDISVYMMHCSSSRQQQHS